MPQKTKRSTQNPLRTLHKIRMASFAGLIVSLLAIQSIANVQATAPATQPEQTQQEVLAYATAVSLNDLYAATNQARANNGMGPLTLSAKLNNGAQAKANEDANKLLEKLLDDFHERAFAPHIDLTQVDANSLDGSNLRGSSQDLGPLMEGEGME